MNNKLLAGGLFVLLLAASGFYLTSRMNQDLAVDDISQPATEQPVKGNTMEKEGMEVETMPNIVETAQAAGSFKTLVAAVEAAGLADTLAQEGPFTVFAPTDEDFAKLPEGTVENLLNQPAELAKILTYHVVAGKVMAEEVVMHDMIETLEGNSLEVVVDEGGVMVNDAKVLTTDIEAENGVIHVIDTVLLPK